MLFAKSQMIVEAEVGEHVMKIKAKGGSTNIIN
jgi:hypothetical protein